MPERKLICPESEEPCKMGCKAGLCRAESSRKEREAVEEQHRQQRKDLWDLIG
jgi:hypothetical protein